MYCRELTDIYLCCMVRIAIAYKNWSGCSITEAVEYLDSCLHIKSEVKLYLLGLREVNFNSKSLIPLL